MHKILAIYAFAQVAWLITEAFVMACLVFPWAHQAYKNKYIQSWSRRVLRTFGVTLKFKNKNLLPEDGGYCIVSNHISWIDIQVIHSIVPCKFITTTEIEAWPVIGKMVQASGALFINLAAVRHSTREITSTMVQMLQAKDTLSFFPEATSTEGSALLPFKANLFQAAVVSQTPVYPLCIQYKDTKGDLSTATGFHGEMTLLECMQNIWHASPLIAEITFIAPAGLTASRKDLSQYCQSEIEKVFYQAVENSNSIQDFLISTERHHT